MDKIKIGVVTASDRASQGIYEDISGVAIMDTMKEYLAESFGCEPVWEAVIKNDFLSLSRIEILP